MAFLKAKAALVLPFGALTHGHFTGDREENIPPPGLALHHSPERGEVGMSEQIGADHWQCQPDAEGYRAGRARPLPSVPELLGKQWQ
jgi:hypothetical protein